MDNEDIQQNPDKRWRLWLSAAVVTSSLLAAGWFAFGQTSPAPQSPPSSIQNVDWFNTQVTLPAQSEMGCPAGPTRLFAASDAGKTYAVSNTDDPSNRLIAMPFNASYGDLTGDGRPEAVMNVQCGLNSLRSIRERENIGQLLVIEMSEQGTLRGLGYVGHAYAAYPTVRIQDRTIVAQHWYEKADPLTSVFGVDAPAHARTYRWNGQGFEQTAGRTSPLVLAPERPDTAAADVTLPSIMNKGTVACPGNTITFNNRESALASVRYEANGTIVATDLDQDLNQELLAQIRCITGGTAKDSIYLLRQTSSGFTTWDVPVANDGTYELLSNWEFTSDVLKVSLKNRQTGQTEDHTLRWNGTSFEGRVGEYDPRQ